MSLIAARSALQTARPVQVLGMAHQFREVEFQSLIEELRVGCFPGGDCGVKRQENMPSLLESGRTEPAAVLSVKLNDGRRANLHLRDLTARVGPKLLTVGQGPFKGMEVRLPVDCQFVWMIHKTASGLRLSQW